MINSEKIFYSNLIKEIKKEISEKKYVSALKKVDEELEQPYIPNEFFFLFSDLKNEITDFINEKNYEEKYANLTNEELWFNCYNESKNFFDINTLFYLLDNVIGEFDDFNFLIFKKIMLSKFVNNSQKFLIISKVFHQNLAFDIEYYNSDLDEIFEINTIEIKSIFDDFKLKINLFEKEFFQNTTYLELSYSMFNLLIIYFFPQKVNFNFDNVLSAIKILIYQYLNIDTENKITRNKEVDIIIKIIENKLELSS